MNKDMEKVLITQEEIQEAAKRLAAQIERDYAGEDEIVFVGLLKGSVQFMADLLKNIDMMCTIDFICVSSYGKGTKSTGRVNIIKDLSEPIDDKNVIIVEDIIDGDGVEALKSRAVAHLVDIACCLGGTASGL